MSKVKLVILSMLAVLAVSAAASGTASATPCSFCTHQWSINGTLLATGAKEEVQGNGLPYVQEGQFESVVSSIYLHLYCQTAILPTGTENVILGGNPGRAKGKIEFTGCGVFQVNAKTWGSETLSACKIAAEPIVATTEGVLTKAGVLELKGVGGMTISKFEIVKVGNSVCAVEAKYEVKGTQVCVIPHNAVSLYVHVIECTPGGSELTTSVNAVGENETNFYLGVGVSLEKGGKFLAT
jgi:hypothetical protein